MTEIPEHLLARSKARRQAIGQDAGGTEPAAEASAPSTAVEPAAGAPPAAAGATAAPAIPTPSKAPAPAAPPPPKPPRPEVAAALSRKKIPWWAVPALAALPVWAAIYAFTLEPPTKGGLLETEGAAAFQPCAACHGPTGGGGVGPQLSGGAVLETFSNYEDQMEWVRLGSEGWLTEHGSTYGDTNKPVLGFSGSPMPGFGGSLSDEEIALIVRYEREALSGEPCNPDLATLTGDTCP